MQDIDETYKDFENSINFIFPNEVSKEDESKSYTNLKDRGPNDSGKIKTKTGSSTSGKDTSSPENYTDKDSKVNKQKNLVVINKEDKKRFGQHENFSFYESFAREIIFQIFDYHLMYFFGYTLKYDESTGKNIEIDGEKKKENKDDKEKNMKKKETKNLDKKENEANLVEEEVVKDKNEIRNENSNKEEGEKFEQIENNKIMEKKIEIKIELPKKKK